MKDWHAHEASFYYDALTLAAARVDLWETEYLHVLDGPEGILEWYCGDRAATVPERACGGGGAGRV